MRACILAFALGVWLLQQQAELPNVRWAWTLLPGAVFALLFSRCRANIFTITGKVLFAGVLLGMGFFWAAAFAQSRLADVLPHEWEGRDIQLIGVVAELPQVNESSVRFAFDVEHVLTEGAIVPARILLAWYGERGKQVTAVRGCATADQRRRALAHHSTAQAPAWQYQPPWLRFRAVGSGAQHPRYRLRARR